MANRDVPVRALGVTDAGSLGTVICVGTGVDTVDDSESFNAATVSRIRLGD